MSKPKLNTIDDYERHVETTIRAWSPAQRVALAAAMAERWLPTYEAFSAAEEWGDPAGLRRILDAVWGHLRGRALGPADVARYAAQVRDSTPHMDDTDNIAALAACVMLDSALDCCRGPNNVAPAIQALLSGFEAVAPDWELDPEEQPHLWRQIAVRRELEKQLKLIDLVGAMAHVDDEVVRALRKRMGSKTFIGRAEPPAEPEKGPAGIINQTAFEQYRSMIEMDLKTKKSEWWEAAYAPGSTLWVTMVFAEWMGRYTRRRDTINGTYGQLADTVAQQALLARQRARERADRSEPEWDAAVREVIEGALQNPFNGFDARLPEQPHGYGPSMRVLWGAARRLGHPEPEAWRHILTWARHRPAAWEAEDRRKKQGLVYSSPALGAALAREIDWAATGDPEHPWAAAVDGTRWQVRLNDFPDDYMYSLLIDGAEAGSFHDWPATWRRG